MKKKQKYPSYRRLTDEEIKLNIYQQTEREILGIYYYVDSSGTNNSNKENKQLKAFDTYGEYLIALSKASILINQGKKVPEPLRKKLIQAKVELERDTVDV